MMDYSVHMVTRNEHKLMVRSLPIVNDFDNPFSPEPSRWSRLLAKVRFVGAHLRPLPHNLQPLTRPTLTTSSPSAFLREQIQEDSNHELDWLWAASEVPTVEEIRYCLERALYINPKNRDTRSKLSGLVARRVANDTLQVDSQNFAQDCES